jgi:BirA family biotin operon repressor/biotin-[acetyl-CoA-carboxylase] ligase
MEADGRRYERRDAPNDIHPGRLRGMMRTRILGRAVALFDAVESTNGAAAVAAARGGAEGAVIVAERQTMGRGRKGRRWHSTAGESLTFSLVLRPDTAEGGLTLLFALAAVETLDAYRAGIGIKWPNDIFCDGKKLGGILAEAGGGAVIMGMGINVHEETAAFPEDITGIAVSLDQLTGESADRGVVLASLLERFEGIYLDWRASGFAPMRSRVEARLLHVGSEVELTTGGSVIGGLLAGITDSGMLRITVDGSDRVYAAGDLTVRRQ